MNSDNKTLFEYKGEPIGRDDLIGGLKDVGLRKGDTIFVHSDIAAFGRFRASDKDLILAAFVEALKEVVGPAGTIVMPTFSYSFCRGQKFDLEKTRSTVGALTEYFRKLPESERNSHPIFSIAASGKNKKKVLNTGTDSFGSDSIFAKLIDLDAKVVFLGASFMANTFVHYIEQSCKVPYRYMKTFKGVVLNNEKVRNTVVTYYVRHLDKDVITNLNAFEKYLFSKRAVAEKKLGGGRILVVRVSDMFKLGMEMLDRDIYAFLDHQPKI